jgi:hypothetical protein
MHGLVAVSFLVAIMVTAFVRLIRFDLRYPAAPAFRNTLGFTLAAIYVGIAVTIATVYMGLTVIPVFAVLTGWSEGYLLSSRRSAQSVPQAVQQPVSLFSFRRVVA